ncbi:guanylate kinase [Waterburya agarophytonicola K14]|uniref:Guanylate kinase n=1 Tax=Waterburya agarophytonicola KI4 TaxID=2874699 RepID=A0A964FGP0_9CYAN|nr:guanylate kinase [Waterburya agarophytonicola]MCC0178286.1 guanylate kinase [Waterburya agarophytonicola KI4]
MPANQLGKLIVITGPSGVGKGTLVNFLLQRHPQLKLSISATTRQPRPGEVEGVNYFFLNKKDFETAILNQELLEWAEYAGNYYGTPKAGVIEEIKQGNYIILEIELAGARSVADLFPEALRIFILPPSIEELEQRIRNRGTNTEESIANRLEIAQKEIAARDEFDLQIVNDDLEQAIALLEAAIFPSS